MNNPFFIEKTLHSFDIDQIAASGQCFRINKQDGGIYFLTAKDKYLRIKQLNKHNVLFSCTEEEFHRVWAAYFDFHTNYEEFQDQIDPNDSYLKEAIKYGSGIRILKQDLWETIISFIISQQNNIPRIKKCIESLCRQFGKQCYTLDQEVYYSFPDAATLAEVTEDELLSCSLGYRSRYIRNTANAVADGSFSLERLYTMDYAASHKMLMTLCGVGKKVADCICLFALHHIDAFPIDTHIDKVLKKYYPAGFPYSKYQGFAGILQQYMFYYDLIL